MKEVNFFKVYIPIITILVIVLCFFAVRLNEKNENLSKKSDDGIRFQEEYSSLNGKTSPEGIEYPNVNLDSNNLYYYASENDIIEVLKSKTGVVYLGFPTCITCRENIDLLNEAAKEYNIDKIYYYNIKPIRTTFSLNENNELVTNKGTDFYYELLQILDDYLDFYKLVSSDDKEIISEEKWLTPCIIFVKNGKLVSFISDFSEEDDLKLKEAFEKNLENICDGKC